MKVVRHKCTLQIEFELHVVFSKSFHAEIVTLHIVTRLLQ